MRSAWLGCARSQQLPASQSGPQRDKQGVQSCLTTSAGLSAPATWGTITSTCKESVDSAEPILGAPRTRQVAGAAWPVEWATGRRARGPEQPRSPAGAGHPPGPAPAQARLPVPAGASPASSPPHCSAGTLHAWRRAALHVRVSDPGCPSGLLKDARVGLGSPVQCKCLLLRTMLLCT